jgi:hypothetical protein
VSRGIALPFHDLGSKMGMGGQHHAPAALPPGKVPVLIVQEAGCVQTNTQIKIIQIITRILTHTLF